MITKKLLLIHFLAIVTLLNQSHDYEQFLWKYATFFLFNEWCIFRWVLLRQQNSNFPESQSIMTEKQTVKTLSPLTTKDETAVHCETVAYSCTVKTRITPQLPILGKRELLWLTSGVYMDRSLCLFRSSLGFCAFLKGNLKIVARCKETIYPNLSISISFPFLSTRNVSFSLIALVLSSWHTPLLPVKRAFVWDSTLFLSRYKSQMSERGNRAFFDFPVAHDRLERNTWLVNIILMSNFFATSLTPNATEIAVLKWTSQLAKVTLLCRVMRSRGNDRNVSECDRRGWIFGNWQRKLSLNKAHMVHVLCSMSTFLG